MSSQPISIQRRALIPLLVLACAASARAQTNTNFDGASEALVGTTLALPGVTFRDLVLDGAGTQGQFSIDAADADLSGQARYSSPNVLGFGAFMAGPYVYPIPLRSFRMTLTQPSSAIRLGLYLHNPPAGNLVDVDFLLNGQTGSVYTIVCSGAPGWHDFDVFQCDNPGPYDEIRVSVRGTANGGRVEMAFDSLTLANAPCGASATYCEGQAGGCPCGNTPSAGSHGGCLNSTGGAGHAIATGIASLAADEVVLNLSSLPPFTSGILVQSSISAAPTPFGDGQMCLGGSPQRVLSLLATQSGFASYPASGQAPLSVRCGVASPDQRHLQLVYRNNAGFCTSSVFNATNATTVVWGP